MTTELARLCLPDVSGEAERRMAWMNSICLLFLLIGVFGRPVAATIEPLAATPEGLSALIEPVALPPTAVPPAAALSPEEVAVERDPAPAAPVTLALPSIRFSVPSIGNLVTPLAQAAVPPLHVLTQPVTAAVPVLPSPATLSNTGVGGERPYPPYPIAAIQRRQQGTVVLTLVVDSSGRISSIEIKSSSGSAILDQSTRDFVQRRWVIPPGAGQRVFEAAVRYVLAPD